MNKQEFMKAWTVRRVMELRKMHANRPHGATCLAMSLIDVKQEGEKLWKKYRPSLRVTPLERLWEEKKNAL